MWQRIDDKHRLRNDGGAGGRLAARVYGEDGKLWPRLALSVFLGASQFQGMRVFGVSLSEKRRPGDWWGEAEGLPVELIGDLPDLFEEAAATLRERLKETGS